MTYFLIGLGGFLGAISRHAILVLVQRTVPQLPFPVITVNLLGCILLGFLFFFSKRTTGQDPKVLYFFVIGFLGSLTTFSAFSIETLLLIRTGQVGFAALSIFANITLCLLVLDRLVPRS